MNAHRWTLRDIATSAGGALLDTLHAARVLAEEGALALGRVFERAAADFGGDDPCGWEVGPVPKCDDETFVCTRPKGHPMPHEADDGTWFEDCGRPPGGAA